MDNYYNFEASRGIAYDDIDLEIDWGLTKTPILSEQDKTLPTLMRAEIFE
jgi:dTDP-4-dehydrorhamnose 3,5-epimerase-like enzyme